MENIVEEKRKVWIYWKSQKSYYAIANKQQLVEPPRVLSSSLSSVNKMVSNGEEQKALMAEIIGLSSSSSDWDKQLRLYWNSLSEQVPEEGRELNIGYKYDYNDNSKKDNIDALNNSLTTGKSKGKALDSSEAIANYFTGQLSVISNRFNKTIIDAAKISEGGTREKVIAQAYKDKYDAIFKLEQEKYKYGTPLNVKDYMLYRYCLVYSAVANEFDLVGKSNNIRFYLHSDEDKERIKQLEFSKEQDRMEVYLNVIKNIDTVDDVLFAADKGSETLGKNVIDRNIMLDKYSKENVEKFVTIATNKNLKTIALIERYITYGILRRLEGSTVIVDSENPADILGSNIDEAVSYFNSKDNKEKILEYKARYTSLPLE